MSDAHDEMRLLMQAELDGELSPAEAARLAIHREQCADCADLSRRLHDLSAAVRREAPYFAMPNALRARLHRPSAPKPRRWTAGVSFAGGVALAACVSLALLPRAPDLEAQAEAAHVRALQPGHLLDVPSSDTHQVKPWFDGKLDFAPPVIDLKATGFPLAGARLDYLDGRPIAALVYARRQHLIDLFVWPKSGTAAPVTESRNGYNIVTWTGGGMTFWAVSDLSLEDLSAFAAQVRQAAS